jgi:hypothetical protein
VDKLAYPLVIVGAVAAYFLLSQQVQSIREAGRAPVQMPVVTVPPPIIPPGGFWNQNTTPEPAPDDFTPVAFDDPSGWFRVSFPGKKPYNGPLANFPQGRTTRYQVARKNVTFEVSHYDSGWRTGRARATDREWLRQCHEGRLKGREAKELTRREISAADAIPGIAFEAYFDKNGEPQTWSGRIYLVEPHIYAVSVYGHAGAVERHAPAFFDSFAFTRKATDWAARARKRDD